MTNLVIEQFARLLVEHVRDMAIASCDLLKDPECNSVDAKRWQEKIKAGNVNDILEMVIPDCVDDTIFQLLHAIDQSVLNMNYNSNDGISTNLTEAGGSELAGLYMAVQGWRVKYSTERLNEDYI